MYTFSKDRFGDERITLEGSSILWKKGQPIAGLIPSELRADKDGSLHVISYALVSRDSAIKAAEAWLSMRGYSIDESLFLSRYALSLPGLLKPFLPFFRKHSADGYIAVIDLNGDVRRVSVTKLLKSPSLMEAIDWEKTAKLGRTPAVHILPEEVKDNGGEEMYEFLIPPAFAVSSRCPASFVEPMKDFVRGVFGPSYQRFEESIHKVNEIHREISPLVPLKERTKGGRGGR